MSDQLPSAIQQLVDVINVDQLLQPIPTASPVGPYLRSDPVYQRIKEMRSADDPSLPSGAWNQVIKVADWAAVQMLALDILTNRSKDLQIAVILTEALIQTAGIAGFTKGCELIVGLHQRFASTMHPAPENQEGGNLPLDENDPGVEHRVSILTNFAEKQSRAIRLLSFALPSQLDKPFLFSVAEREMSIAALNRVIRAPEDRRLKAEAQEAQNSLSRMEQALGAVPLPSLQDLSAQSGRALYALHHLWAVLDQVYGRFSPELSRLNRVLEDLHEIWLGELQQRSSRGV